ncbi:MAG: alcohol dehydrogenase catalytic domain-containing protein [Candidatus Dormibacteraeota bacterium]|nr:alcohol dehydrogenase catalytic domain-containing protein [Candidatus Dormibacteraeota bacterium]
MKAVLLDQTGPIEDERLRVADVDIPEPGPGEVLLRVQACGVCRSNLHMIEGDWVANGVPGKLPIIPDHEVVGTVAKIGHAVDGLFLGDRVGVQPLWWTDGTCEFCLSAREHLCWNKQITGETVDGGYAEFMVASAAHVHPVPELLTAVEAAPLFCPGITAYSAVAQARIRPGDRVAVFGLGGVGHMAVQVARAFGAEVIAADRNPLHLDVARELGAVSTIDVRNVDAGEALAADKGGVDAALVFAPSDVLTQQALYGVRRGGTLVLGVSAQLPRLAFFEAKTIVESVIGNRADMRRVLKLAEMGLVRSVAEPYPLDRAVDALRALKRGELRSRAVLTP